ncbi:MAG: SDR family NAD(P)-dependent oxidoreductase [Verrucomicrobia bacterium]|nr:SDR family NAD(P)-dependent oxidoreductase [Verrucomicrobiota bacterium]
MTSKLQSMKGKVVLITGATRGIGRAGALRLATLEAKLILLARHRGRLEEVARLCRAAGSPEVRIFVVDLSSQKQVAELGKKLMSSEPRLEFDPSPSPLA